MRGLKIESSIAWLCFTDVSFVTMLPLLTDEFTVTNGSSCNGTYRWQQAHDSSNSHAGAFWWKTRSLRQTGPDLIAGLPSSRLCVLVGPPLAARAPSSSRASSSSARGSSFAFWRRGPAGCRAVSLPLDQNPAKPCGLL